VKLIRLAAFGYNQRHVLIGALSIGFQPNLSENMRISLAAALPRRSIPAINGECSFRVHTLKFAIGWACSIEHEASDPSHLPPRIGGLPFRAKLMSATRRRQK
jgi:hypothetical protein